jgi:hypothetical protein
MLQQRSHWKPDRGSVAQDRGNQPLVGEKAVLLTEAPIGAHNRLDDMEPAPGLGALTLHVRGEGVVDVIDYT